MMCSISFFYTHSSHTVVGNLASILMIANLLEKQEMKFKVADVRGYQQSQKSFGVGDFKFWLNPEDRF